MTYTFMRIYWKSDFNALKELIEKYVKNKDICQVGFEGWEILVRSEKILREIKKFCRYRNKKLIIDEIEELEEGIDEEDEELDEIEELEDETGKEIGIEPIKDELFHMWEDIHDDILLEDLPSEEELMEFYRYPENACDCNPADECGCEAQQINLALIEKAVIEGRYGQNAYSWKRLEMEQMKNYY